MSDLVSVITVARNAAETIAATIASVNSQDHPHIEHIIIDGASVDNTLAIAKAKAQRVACIVSEPDAGIFDAMNKGIRKARGQWIIFLNADDVYISKDAISRLIAMVSNSQTRMVFGDVEFVSHPPRERIIRRYSAKEFRPGLLAWGWMPPHPGILTSRALFDEIGLFDVSYEIAGDYEWLCRLFSRLNPQYQYAAIPVVRMRVGGVSTSGIRSTLKLNREVLRGCRHNGIGCTPWRLGLKYVFKLREFWA